MEKSCGNCANGTWTKGMDDLPKECLRCRYVCGEPSKWKEKAMTNADRIRAMSDVELARELAAVAGWDRTQYEKAKHIGIEKVMLDWLRRSV